MQRALTLYNTTVGKKVAMALSGTVILGFAVGHMAGNLQAFAGAQVFNEYSAMLHGMPAVLWGTRIVLLAAFSAHIASAFQLWQRNRGATGGKSARYKFTKNLATDYAARTMYWSGPILAVYVVFHLMHLTLGGMIFGDTFLGENLLFIEGYTFDRHNPFNNMVYGFQNWGVVITYAIGVIALGFHLFHGIYSLFQSLGLSHPKYNELRRDLAIAVAVLLTAGFLSLPIAAMASHLSADIAWLEPTTQQFYFPELN